MTTFLLDANLSPETRRFLEQRFGLDVMDLLTTGLGHLSDEDVVALAKRERRVIVTLDRDFGEIYYRRERGQIGVTVLRVRDQTVEGINAVLERFFTSEASSIDLDHSLVIVEPDRLRVLRGSP